MNADGWIENPNGNWVWIRCGELVATVYATDDNEWCAIWNGAADSSSRRLKGKFDCAEDAQEEVEVADGEGEESPKWHPPDDQWIERKGGGYYRKVNGLVVSVKQAKSKSWYAVRMGGGLLGRSGRTSWFSTAEKACRAVDELNAAGGDWRWMARD
jgi:hypothetical protein